MEGSRRLLTCLQYPFAANVNFSSKADLIILVCWLEDRKIRELEIEEREALRSDGERWNNVFAEYLENLGCPYTWTGEVSTSAADCISWFIAHAVSAEYEDAADACIAIEETASESYSSCSIDDKNSSMDIEMFDESKDENADLRRAIDELGALLALTRHQQEPNLSYLQRIARQVRLFLTEGSLNSLTNKGANGIPLTAFPSVFECADPLVKQLGVVLRMLYLSDYRELQNDLNALIVLGQEYTANPKTNSALGVVGR